MGGQHNDRHARRKEHHTPASRRFSPLFILALLSLLQLASAATCLRFADYNNINQAFIDGGPGTKVFLCPSKTYRLTGTIVFTAADQELATLGYPTGSERARLLVNGGFATAIQGDCRRCARVTVTNVIVDGNRARLGRMVDSSLATGLIIIGGNEGQTIKNSWIKDPRGFTAIHVREGDKLQCKSATIEKNEIGPVGEEYKPDVDGSDPEMSPLGRPLADGVSIACRDSYVRGNTFYDNTDAAIVVYCSPGTLVHANTITTRKMSSMGGILMIDAVPFEGDYSGTIIKSNIIDAATRIIRVGIGIGAAVWSDDTETILKGGSVLANGLRGRYMGFGIAAAGLDGWKIKDNWDESTHSGVRSHRCFDDSTNPEPTAFLRNELVKNTEFQPGFVEQNFEYIVCIDGTGEYVDYTPPEPEPIDARSPEENQKQKQKPVKAPPKAAEPEQVALERYQTGSEVMDDILEHSQARMLEAIDVLSHRVDLLAQAAEASGAATAANGEISVAPQIAVALNDLRARVAVIEARQHSMLETTSAMRSALQSWDVEMATSSEWQYDILLDVQHRLNLYKPHSLHAIHHDAHDHHDAHHNSQQSTYKPSGRAETGTESAWAQPLRFILAQAVFLAAVVFGRRWWLSRTHSKVL